MASNKGFSIPVSRKGGECVCCIFPIGWDWDGGEAAVYKDFPAFVFDEEAEFAVGQAEVGEELGCWCV